MMLQCTNVGCGKIADRPGNCPACGWPTKDIGKPIRVADLPKPTGCQHFEWISIASHKRGNMKQVTLVYGPGLNVADELRWCVHCGALQRVVGGQAEAWLCPRDTCTHR